MTKRRLTFTATVLALIVGATPAVADAAQQNKLMGAPTFEVWTDQFHAVQLPLDKKLTRKDGKYRITVTVGSTRSPQVRFKRTHGSDYVYEARIPVKGFSVGKKYTLKVALPGQSTITRTVTLKEIPGERSPF